MFLRMFFRGFQPGCSYKKQVYKKQVYFIIIMIMFLLLIMLTCRGYLWTGPTDRRTDRQTRPVYRDAQSHLNILSPPSHFFQFLHSFSFVFSLSPSLYISYSKNRPKSPQRTDAFNDSCIQTICWRMHHDIQSHGALLFESGLKKFNC